MLVRKVGWFKNKELRQKNKPKLHLFREIYYSFYVIWTTVHASRQTTSVQLKKKKRLTETERIKFGNKSAIIHISHYQKTFGKLVNKQWTRIQQCRKNEEHNFKSSRCFRTKKVHYLLFWNFERIRIVLILLFFQTKLYVRTRTIKLFFYIILTKQTN